MKWMHMIAMLMLVIGGLNWGLIGMFHVDLVQWLFGRGSISSAIYVLVGVAALLVAFRRDTYLPFLGETVMPCSLVADRTPEHADTEVRLNGLEPGAKLLFWATEPATEGLARIKDWRQAYLDFANAGVTTADAAGHALLRIRKPQPYTVPMKGELQPHVHWRVCGGDGLLGPVRTTTITGGPIIA